MDDSTPSVKDERERLVRELRQANARRAMASTHPREDAADTEGFSLVAAAVIENADYAIIAKTLDGTIVGWNPAAERLYGYTAAEVLGRPISLLLPPDRPDEVAGLLQKIECGESIAHYETVRARKDGSLIRVSLSVSPIRDADGRAVGAATIARDIAERHRQAEQLREANERILIAGVREQEAAERAEMLAQSEHQARLAAEEAQRRVGLLVEAGSVLASSLDYETTLQQVARLAVPDAADWCVVDLLQEGEMRWGVAIAHVDPAKEALIRDLYPQELGDTLRLSLYAEPLHGSEPMLVPEYDEVLLARMAGDAEARGLFQQLGPRSLVAAPLVARGRTLGAIRFLISESDHRYGPDDLPLFEELARHAAMAIDSAQLYREAQDANAAKDRFLAMVSHELRNPLSTIVAGAGLLRQALPDEARVQRTLQAIEKGAKLQARLIEDLLDLSRMTRGELRLREAPVRLDTTVAAAAQSLQAEVERSGLTLTLDLPDTGLWVRGDADRLHQVVTNLITNAIKFTPPEGEMRVACETHNTQHARIVVEDTGIGIDAALLAHLFEMFRQGDASGKRKSGLGIGLALVKGVVAAHGGRVWAESEGVGKGSRFIVELPLIAPPNKR